MDLRIAVAATAATLAVAASVAWWLANHPVSGTFRVAITAAKTAGSAAAHRTTEPYIYAALRVHRRHSGNPRAGAGR